MGRKQLNRTSEEIRKQWRNRSKRYYEKHKTTCSLKWERIKNDPSWLKRIYTQQRKRKQVHYFKYKSSALRSKRKEGYQISALELWSIAKKQKLICPLTGRKLTCDNISIDHKIPLSNGGTNEPSNLRFIDYHANLADLYSLAFDLVKTAKK